MNEDYITVDYETIGVQELRQLQDLSHLNKMFSYDDYYKIINVYKSVIDKLSKKLPENK
jgi:hypothetical protein